MDAVLGQRSPWSPASIRFVPFWRLGFCIGIKQLPNR